MHATAWQILKNYSSDWEPFEALLKTPFPPILQGRLTVENEGNQCKAPTESFPTHELPAIAVSLDCLTMLTLEFTLPT